MHHTCTPRHTSHTHTHHTLHTLYTHTTHKSHIYHTHPHTHTQHMHTNLHTCTHARTDIYVRVHVCASTHHTVAHTTQWHTPHSGTHPHMLCRHTIQWHDSPVIVGSHSFTHWLAISNGLFQSSCVPCVAGLSECATRILCERERTVPRWDTDYHCWLCMTLWGKPERQHVQDLEQLHAHTVNRMSLSVAQPQATEQRKKYTMHMHNTADTSTRAQHGYKYICTTQVRVHMHNMWLQELWVRLAEEVPSHTAYVDTAHWSSTPCAWILKLFFFVYCFISINTVVEFY